MSGVRPELIRPDPAACKRVREQVAVKGGCCEACGATDFVVGDAMLMGFLFLDEDSDSYMVALTCSNPDCPKPRTGIKLCGKDFLSEEQRATAMSRRSTVA